MADLNKPPKRKGISRLYYIVEEDLAAAVTNNWKTGLKVRDFRQGFSKFSLEKKQCKELIR